MGVGERVHEVLGMMSLNLHITESGDMFKTFLQDHLFEPSLFMSFYGLVVLSFFFFFLIYKSNFRGGKSHFNNLFYLKLFYSNSFMNCVVFFNVHKLFIAQFWKALSQILKK